MGAWGLAALRCDARGFRSYQVPARIKIVLVIALVETAKCALLSRGSNKGSDCRPTPRGLVDTNSLFFDLASGSIGLEGFVQRVLESHSPICAFVAHRSLLNTTRLYTRMYLCCLITTCMMTI